MLPETTACYSASIEAKETEGGGGHLRMRQILAVRGKRKDLPLTLFFISVISSSLALFVRRTLRREQANRQHMHRPMVGMAIMASTATDPMGMTMAVCERRGRV